jgi:hypothetical protein
MLRSRGCFYQNDCLFVFGDTPISDREHIYFEKFPAQCLWLTGGSDLEHRSLKSVFPAKEVFIMVLMTCISILALLIFLSVTGPGD